MSIFVILFLFLSQVSFSSECISFYRGDPDQGYLENTLVLDLGEIHPGWGEIDPGLFNRKLRYVSKLGGSSTKYSVAGVVLKPFSTLSPLQSEVVNNLRSQSVDPEIMEMAKRKDQNWRSGEQLKATLPKMEETRSSNIRVHIQSKLTLAHAKESGQSHLIAPLEKKIGDLENSTKELSDLIEKAKTYIRDIETDFARGVEVGSWTITLKSGREIKLPMVTSFLTGSISSNDAYQGGYLKALQDLNIDRGDVVKATFLHIHPSQEPIGVLLSPGDIRSTESFIASEAAAGYFPSINIVAVSSNNEVPVYSHFGLNYRGKNLDSYVAEILNPAIAPTPRSDVPIKRRKGRFWIFGGR